MCLPKKSETHVWKQQLMRCTRRKWKRLCVSSAIVRAFHCALLRRCSLFHSVLSLSFIFGSLDYTKKRDSQFHGKGKEKEKEKGLHKEFKRSPLLEGEREKKNPTTTKCGNGGGGRRRRRPSHDSSAIGSGKCGVGSSKEAKNILKRPAERILFLSSISMPMI